MRAHFVRLKTIIQSAVVIIIAVGSVACDSSFSAAAKPATGGLASSASSTTQYKLEMIQGVNTFADDQTLGSVTIGGSIYFFANKNGNTNLWEYDGASITKRSETNPFGNDRSWSGGLKVLSGVLYFTAYNYAGQVKAYRFRPGIDELVTDPIASFNNTFNESLSPKYNPISSYPGPSMPNRGDDFYPGLFSPFEILGIVYFVAYNGADSEVYKYDPVTEVTTAITDIGPADTAGLYSQAPVILGVIGGTLLIGLDDGTGMGVLNTYVYTPGDPVITVPTSTLSIDGGADYRHDIPGGIEFDGKIFFTGSGVSGGFHNLYSYVPGDTVTTTISNTTGGGDDNASDLTVIGTALYFSAVDASGIRNIYEYSSGDPAVTTPVSGLCGGNCTIGQRPMGLAGGEFYFTASSGLGNTGFHKVTLVSANTADPISGAAAFSLNTLADSNPSNLTNVNGTLFFTAYTGFINHDSYATGVTNNGYNKVYKLSAAGIPVQVSNTAGAGVDDDPQNLINVNGTLFFTAKDSGGLRKLYQHTQEQVGLTTVARTNINNGGDDLYSNPIVAGGLFYFTCVDVNGFTKLYKLDPSSGAVITDADAISNTSGGDDLVSNMYNVDGAIYFLASDGGGLRKLFKYTGSPGAVTTAITDINPGVDDNIGGFLALNDKFYFSAIDVNGYTRLYVDSVSNAVQITAVNAVTNTSNGVDDTVTGLYTVGGNVYFSAFDDLGGQHYYKLVPGDPVVDSADIIDPPPPRDDYDATSIMIMDGYLYSLKEQESLFKKIMNAFDHFISPIVSIFVPDKAQAFGVQYLKKPKPIPGPAGVQYVPIAPIGAPVAYVRVCSMYGSKKFAGVNGVAYFFGAYRPGSDSCPILSMGPNSETVTDPFPDTGRSQTVYGVDGTWGLWEAPGNTLYFSAGYIRPSHAITTNKLQKFLMGTVTEISPNVGGDDRPSGVTVIGDSVYFTIDTCGGHDAISVSGAYNQCRNLYKYSPL